MCAWITLPALFGLIVFIQTTKTGDIRSPVVFGLFVTVWCTVYLESWKRTQSTVAHEWGMEGERCVERCLWKPALAVLLHMSRFR